MMAIDDLLLFIAVIVAWMALMLLWPLCAVWMTLPVVLMLAWLVVKNMEGE